MHVVVLCDDNLLGQAVLGALHANRVRSWLITTSKARWLRYSVRTTLVMTVDGPLESRTAAIIDEINDLHLRYGIDVVLPTDVRGALFLCDNRQRLQPTLFPIAERPVLELLDDKWRFALLCQQLGIPTPRTLYFDKAAINVDDVGRKIGFPVVMKPINEWGGAGVVQAKSRQQLGSIMATYCYPRVVVQEYIEGTDVGVSLFAREGEVLCEASFFCGTKTRTEFAPIPQFLECARHVIEATGYTGVANFDGRLDRSGNIHVFECNPRFFFRLNFLRIAGIDFLRLGLPGTDATSGCEATGVMYSLTDMRGLMRMLIDRTTARRMFYSWYGFLSDPAPRLMSRLSK